MEETDRKNGKKKEKRKNGEDIEDGGRRRTKGKTGGNIGHGGKRKKRKRWRHRGWWKKKKIGRY